MVPTKAYVTFENEYTLNLMKGLESCNVLNVMSELDGAPEPSDINWENKGTNGNYRLKRLTGLLIVLSGILVFNFLFQDFAYSLK